MSESIRLAQIRPGMTYTVSGFEAHPTGYTEKLAKMGFTTGTRVALAPVNLTDPLVFLIRGSRIALRRQEAGRVLVKEVSNG